MGAQAALGSGRPAEQRGTRAQAAEQDDRGNDRQQHDVPRVTADPYTTKHDQNHQTAMKPMMAHSGAIRPVAMNQIDIASSAASARPPST